MRYAVVVLCLLLHGCVVHELAIEPVEPIAAKEAIVVESPVKAHLKNGYTVVFAKGIRVEGDTVYGDGRIFDMTLDGGTVVKQVPVDDIAAMESYQTPVNTPASAVGSVAGGTVGTLAALSAMLLLFGSCPTVYSFEGGEALLEAETFSYSIAPSFQSRDIYRLGLVPVDGLLELEVRNEMLETHYIDQIEILEIAHRPDERAVPDHKGRALVVGKTLAPTRAFDQGGKEVLAALATADDNAWRAG